MPRLRTYQRTFGQFFTPDVVVTCCYQLLRGRLPSSPHIVDPACGDGAFLRYAAQHGIAAPDELFGCDVDVALVQTLHANGLHQVQCVDGLAPQSLPAHAFDLVVGNPPFGIATRTQGASPLASEVQFLLRAIDIVRPGGYIALVLPNGVLANRRLQSVRASILQQCTLQAVIALPRETFRDTGTNAACSIVVLHKAPFIHGHQIFFALAHDLDDLSTITAAYHAGQTLAPAIHLVSSTETATETYWLPYTDALVERMDAAFWRPTYCALLERMATRYPLQPLGKLLERRRNLIAGDHVRPSRGEARGANLPYEYYQTREFLAAGYNYAALERCNEPTYQRLKYTAVHQHDILVSCAGVGGAGNARVCLITHRPGPSCTGDVLIVRLSDPTSIFLFLFLTSVYGRMQLLRLQNGVGTVNISTAELLQVQVPLVPSHVQQVFAARYAPIVADHDAAMAALQYGDVMQFQMLREAAERRLSAVCNELEQHIVIG
ncbi:MAG: hypothetical protein GFH27_549279n342 [Chloroflexi bacterium AL-W]|nr:hypothetical protein [Chloroflexi bacterium AL-W]